MSENKTQLRKEAQINAMSFQRVIDGHGHEVPLRTATPLLWQGAHRHELASARYSDRALFRFLFRVASWEKSLEVTSSYNGRV